MDPNRYHLLSTWRLPAPPGAVYRALRDVPDYPLWWPQVREVHRLDDDAGRLRVRSLLPYSLRFTARELRQDEAAGVLEAELSGDLAGWSRWSVDADGPGRSRAVFEEEVRPGKRLMRLLALPGRPLFLANHAVMMRAGERGLRRRLSGEPPPG
ncbi:SRPBCC family protein [Kitasatospora viridis]|uniref:Polyketide cyclase/dehydrase/lipid transport protein n=1 Tax=Kitasatospora viridis TaxID=281105 RepID=A0A561UDF5_9ACTN|nr:SRPBCC family protein [Kitasatospora viridis]TWF97403.1 polyketide cyclase/dehydrase/lipid transport protein [Kitasatospora viridis]